MKTLEPMIRTFIRLHPEEAAHTLESIDPEVAVKLIQRLPSQSSAELLAWMRPDLAAQFLPKLGPARAGELLVTMPMREASGVLQHMEDAAMDEALMDVPARHAEQLRQLRGYPAESAGGMMDPKVFALPIDLTVQEAINRLRRAPRQTLYYLYVTARSGELVGVMTMRDLLLNPARSPIEPLVRRPALSVPATMPTHDVMAEMAERKLLAMPVVDADNKLVGVIRNEQVHEAGKLEAFEDMQKMVGAGEDERALSPVTTVIKRRLPWLFVNLATAFIAAAVVGLFEGIIAKVTALAVLLPVVAGQAGNTGSQSLAIVMRGLALRELGPGTAKRVIFKEGLGGLLNGLAIGTVTAFIVGAYSGVGGSGEGAEEGATATRALGLALVIGLSMPLSMFAAALSGAVIPLILRALGRDPAQSAGIFLTTVTDVVGFASFLGFAVAFSAMIV